MQWSDKRMVRLIGLFKLFKAALMLAVAVAAFRLIHADVIGLLEHWVLRTGLDPGGPRVGRLLVTAASLTPTKIADVGVGSLIYAALFLTEGIGLWFLKRWAEWLTVIITSLLIPVEVWEIFRHPNFGKILVLLINAALVIYLVYEVRKSPAESRVPH
jgi:uncharacterized membrane protein (DUF2068 family)